ncbi:MAG TPA: DUF167 domain-containing protein [Phycisphaerae bacterium]|nr:DUF167 domain-containing protein [Phycisphaerae bacterium]
MLELTATKGGTLLRVKVTANAKRTALLGLHGGALKVAVAAPAQQGRANRALIKFIGELLGVAAGQIEIARGHSNTHKALHVKELSPDRIAERLASLLKGQ